MSQDNFQICIVGLGYVGLPLAVAFGKKEKIYGFDIDETRVTQLQAGEDITQEVSAEQLAESDIAFSSDPSIIEKANFIIVAVPTPIDASNKPDLRILLDACDTVGKHMQKGSIVVFESTVYPGCTEEDCIPILEKASGLTFGTDFTVGYSPERINPGDKKHTIDKVVKIVSGSDADTLAAISQVYERVVRAGVHKAPSIKVAEAAKIIENTQRDINIALMNELKMIFDTMDIDTQEVLAAAGTKWNFLTFHPGLVGGHCIGVDPYYLAHKSEKMGHHPKMILAGREINDAMAVYEAKRFIDSVGTVDGTKILILGCTFKPNVPDLRNSKVKDFIAALTASGKCSVDVCEPFVEGDVFGCTNVTYQKELSYDHIILAVKHDTFVHDHHTYELVR